MFTDRHVSRHTRLSKGWGGRNLLPQVIDWVHFPPWPQCLGVGANAFCPPLPLLDYLRFHSLALALARLMVSAGLSNGPAVLLDHLLVCNRRPHKMRHWLQ